MRKSLLITAAFALMTFGLASAEVDKSHMDETMTKIGQLQEAGKFSDADALVKQELADTNLSPGQRTALEYEIERSARIRKDFTLGEDSLKKALKGKIKDFTDEDFAKWLSENRFDFKEIDGKKMYNGSSAANLFFRYPDINARRIDPPSTKIDDFLWIAYNQLKAEITRPAQSTGKPHQFKLTMTITVNSGAVPKGTTIRCWMPYPLQTEFQSGVELLKASPEPKWVNNPNYPTRSLYFEQPSNGDAETVFQATYSLTTYARMNVIDNDLVSRTSQRAGSSDFDYFTREQDHVHFTPEIKALAKQIVKDETNPAVKARLIYEYIANTKKYSYSREYSTLRDIPKYVCENGYGDCGQLALTFITLCRSEGIPARWESGWIIYPQKRNLHDWSEIWLAPYGWIPVDPNYGLEIQNYFPSYTPEMKTALQDFYFGGLDAYRLVANHEHSYPHNPEKISHRSDDVDFQRGEVEADGKNIYFDQFDYKMDAEFLTPADAEAEKASKNPAPGAVLKPGVVR